MTDRFVYLDNAATTSVKPEVLEEMMPYFIERYGNASTVYSLGRQSREAVDKARDRVATAIGAKPEEIFFTSGGTEADNWAIKGAAYANRKKGNHIITSSIEHHAVLHTCEYLEREGFKVTYLPVGENGIVDPERVKEAITPETILISIMFANNEIGTIQPIKEIGEIARQNNIIFHTDAVQAIGNIHIDMKELAVDLLSMSGHKIYGPKGVGALYIRKGAKLIPYMHGGAQERGKRASTENVPGIVGMGKAIELATSNIDIYNNKLLTLREKAIEGIMEKIPYVRLNGDRESRLPGNVNVSIEYIEGESLLLMLDMMGIAASSGSACTSGSLDPSHVLLAIGLPHEIAHGSLRLTFGDNNTTDDVDYLLKVLPDIVERLRDMSPLYEKIKKEHKA